MIRIFTLIASFIILLFLLTGYFEKSPPVTIIADNLPLIASPTASPRPTPTVPPRKIIPIKNHVFQTFNNCGPASLSMLLSYFEITVSQEELGRKLRPFQHPQGNNDDKSVTLAELAKEAENYGLTAYHRPNGNPQILQQFIAEGIPVVIRTWLKEGEDIGHYRLIRGYDLSTRVFIQDDSLQNKNLSFSFTDLVKIWEPFNYEFLVLLPGSKVEIAEAILGENLDETTAWDNARQQLEVNRETSDIYRLFNLSVANYHLGRFKESVNYFEQVENMLPWRMLWYQIEPIEAYFQLNDYSKVFSLTDKVLNNYNRAFSELYYLRGQIYRKQQNLEAAGEEFEKAVYYNVNFTPTREAILNIQGKN
ncbi:MAG: hypothetical protein UV73_C0003G0065 [Candidatus Gottesmanbacteria bacterium GW2011_GWA2_43_14]|uniref:Peptidase C39 domain-containing protein n=1 Tax=Candidatus Gottesmanbacteria bacterium GW2011_GWA2_43_14 TaxID=1618443 RepID=A0A0G1GH63_9BACT|nr:MAG: hypothetical protein UV73_C0003G0065 [Candidatus Gottesmanbacteria bacterium GW2011_GWA2_43_14]